MLVAHSQHSCELECARVKTSIFVDQRAVPGSPKSRPAIICVDSEYGVRNRNIEISIAPEK